MTYQLPAREVLDAEPSDGILETIGRSREGRSVRGGVFGRGPKRVSLIAGCHADEPVGPDTLARLTSFLAADSQAQAVATWFVVPHVNPDGRERNRSWSRVRLPVTAPDGSPDLGFDLGLYLANVEREGPGDDIEFGFPPDETDREARPENRAVAKFLRRGAPFAVHGSLHGMGLAVGPWHLLEESWVDRTLPLREAMRQRVRAMGYELLDVDRGGEKGFHRIDEGFSTRPDSRAMRRYFLELEDPETACRFRPSSMELVRSLGGDPLTFVTENPLFLLPTESDVTRIRSRLEAALAASPSQVSRLATELGVQPMPIGRQQELQIAFLNAALAAVGV